MQSVHVLKINNHEIVKKFIKQIKNGNVTLIFIVDICVYEKILKKW